LKAAWLPQVEAWARHAGAIQRGYFRGAEVDIHHKGDIDLVTAADKACEDYLVKQIEAAFPEHGYIAEEGHQKSTRGELTWYIDPLDGTTNFAHGYPVFACSIALLRNDEPILGVVYNPISDEMFSATRGGGAFLNGRLLTVSRIDALKQALLVSGFPYAFLENPLNLQLWGAFLHAAQSVRRDGSAALDLCYVADGRFEGFWELGLHSWDVAAGALIVTEAGGRVTQFDGSRFNVDAKNILATNGPLHEAMQAVLKNNGAY
jgi:myo-inositol-1(or 4)-monophosphatase